MENVVSIPNEVYKGVVSVKYLPNYPIKVVAVELVASDLLIRMSCEVYYSVILRNIIS